MTINNLYYYIIVLSLIAPQPKKVDPRRAKKKKVQFSMASINYVKPVHERSPEYFHKGIARTK